MGHAFLQATVLDDGGLPCEGRFAWGYSLVGGAIFAPQYTWWQRSISPYDQFPFWNYPPDYAHGSYLFTGDQFTALLSSLPGGTTIYYQAQIRNPSGTAVGSIKTFATSLSGSGGLPAGWPYPLPPGVGGPMYPSVGILAPTLVTNSQATLNGVVSAQGDVAGSVRFHWGTSSLYGMTTPWQDGIGTGTSFSSVITGLSAGAAYHVRAEFKNSHGQQCFSNDLTFSTLSETGGMVLVSGDILTIIGGDL